VKRAIIGLGSALIGLLTQPAFAQDETSEASGSEAAKSETSGDDRDEDPKADDGDKKADDSEADEDFGHMGQFGLRFGVVFGYRMVFRYDTSPYCREPDPMKAPKDQVKFCGHGAPLAGDLALSFGLLDMLEPYLWARLGFAEEPETNTEPVRIIGVGVRIYTMSDSAFKIFVEPAVAYEFEGGGDDPTWGQPVPGYDPNYKKDIVFHLAAGPHWDFHKNFGAYADAGLTTGILRGIHSVLELQLGVQGRLP
jgi:hypothetical protein